MMVSFSPLRPTETEVPRKFDQSPLAPFLADPLHYDCWSDLFVRFIVPILGPFAEKHVFSSRLPGSFFLIVHRPTCSGYARVVQGCEEF